MSSTVRIMEALQWVLVDEEAVVVVVEEEDLVERVVVAVVDGKRSLAHTQM